MTDRHDHESLCPVDLGRSDGARCEERVLIRFDTDGWFVTCDDGHSLGHFNSPIAAAAWVDENCFDPEPFDRAVAVEGRTDPIREGER